MVKSYEFDPCSLDDWKLTEKKEGIIQSEWRKRKIGENYNQEPGLDDLKKIERYLKNKSSDAEIMNAFGINAETLVAIKKNKYCPVEGISSDNLSKIYREFKIVNESIKKLKISNTYLSTLLENNKKESEESFSRFNTVLHVLFDLYKSNNIQNDNLNNESIETLCSKVI